eukprot:Hpha_TRINITY_DN15787_c0_g1::TRINITY_DN15787_c0_g1_i1::g.39176::m.39176
MASETGSAASARSKGRASARGTDAGPASLAGSVRQSSRRSLVGAGEAEDAQVQLAVEAPTPGETGLQPPEPAEVQKVQSPPQHDLPPLRRPRGDSQASVRSAVKPPQSPTSPIFSVQDLNATVASISRAPLNQTSSGPPAFNLNQTTSGATAVAGATPVAGGGGDFSRRGSEAAQSAGGLGLTMRSAVTPLEASLSVRVVQEIEASLERSGSKLSLTGRVPQEVQQDEPQEAEPALASAAELQAEVETLQSQVARLTASNESLSRLMQSSSQDAKVRLLTEDLNKRAAAIKKLEDEVRNQKKRAERAESKLEEKDSKAPGAAAPSAAPADTKELDAKKKEISELKKKVESLNSSLDTERDRRAAAEQRAAAGEAMKLRLQEVSQAIIQKDVQIHHLEQRLQRAQDAIVNAAGSGYENDVKLQRTRGALINILKDGGKQTESPSPARNPELAFSPRFIAGYSASPPKSTSPRRERPIYFLA